MKKVYNYLALSLLVGVMGLTFVSCDKKDPVDPPEEPNFKVETASPIVFDKTDAGSKDIIVTAEHVTWTAASDEASASWLSIDPKVEEGKVTVSVTKNTDFNTREGTVTITPNSEEFNPVTIEVTQIGTMSFVVRPKTLEFAAKDNEPQVITVAVAEGMKWKFDVEEAAKEWLSAELVEGGIKVTVADNETEEPLEGKITVTVTDPTGLDAEVVQVSQAAGEKPGPGPGPDPDPSLEADKLEASFGPEADQTEDIGVTAEEVEWDVRIEQTGNWLEAEKGEGKVTIKIIEANPSEDERTGKVILYGEGVEDVVIEVTQEGKEPEEEERVILLDTYLLEVVGTGLVLNSSSEVITVTAPGTTMGDEWKTWVDDAAADWLIAEKMTTSDPHFLRVRYRMNPSDQPRSGKVYVQDEAELYPVTVLHVRQEAGLVLEATAAAGTEITPNQEYKFYLGYTADGNTAAFTSSDGVLSIDTNNGTSLTYLIEFTIKAIDSFGETRNRPPAAEYSKGDMVYELVLNTGWMSPQAVKKWEPGDDAPISYNFSMSTTDCHVTVKYDAQDNMSMFVSYDCNINPYAGYFMMQYNGAPFWE